MTPELLAALAQVEGAGNPVARTPWRVRASADPREIYRPASSAVGMYQITDGTFREAKRYCIRDHVADRGGLLAQQPVHARDPEPRGRDDLGLPRPQRAPRCSRASASRRQLAQKQDLAALIHLCGAARRRRLRAARLSPDAPASAAASTTRAPISPGSTR